MSRIVIKAPNIKYDSENVVNIGVPKKNQFNFEEFEHDQVNKEKESEEIEQQRINLSNEYEAMINDAKNEASSIIKNAENKAKKIIDDAKNDAENQSKGIKKQAHDEGYNKGYQEGVTKSNKLINDAKKELANAKAEHQKILKDIEPETINLIVQICHKLLNDSININPNVISFLIKNGLEQATVTGDINIHVSQDDYDFVLENKQKIQTYTEGTANMEIIKDFSITKGDCIIETPLGNIDSSLSGQLNLLTQDLYFILENR